MSEAAVPGSVEQALERVEKYESSLPFFKVRVGERTLRLAVPNAKCLYFAREFHKREPATNEWIAGFEPAEVFFDIGANNGVYALLAALRTEAPVYAFEPHFASYHTLCRTVYANGLEGQINVLPIALAGRDDIATLFLSDTYAGKSLNQFGRRTETEDPLHNAVIPQAAISLSLDRVVALTGVLPAHIKIDVDGLEPEILAGGSDTLADPALRSVCVEVEERHRRDIVATMAGAGLTVDREGSGNLFFRRA